MYEELPPTYRDREGLAFAKRDLSPAEVAKIFGNKIKPEFANNLLKIMHGRRVAGTLEDPAYKANTARFTNQQKEAALRYLRKTIPVDETMNKGLRAQDELEQLEKEIAGMKDGGKQTPAQGTKESVPSTPAVATNAKELETPQEEDPEAELAPRGNPAYGVSALDRIRARNIARIRAEEKRIAEEEKIKGEPVAGTLEAYVDRGAVSPRMQKWQEQGSSGLQEPPKLSYFERVFPSMTFAALIVAASVGFAALYTAPEEHDRVFWDLTPEMATVGTLIGLNVAVYFAWKIPPMWRILNNYFMLVVAMPRPITMLTSMFSHQRLSHMALNMAVLYYIGSRLHDEIGRGNFLAIYLSSGVMGFASSLALHGLEVASLGASGAVLGITAAYFYLHAWDKFRIMGFPAPPAEGVDGFAFLVSVVLWNAIAAFAPARLVSADVISHLAGMFSGIGVVAVLRDVAMSIPGANKGAGGSGFEELVKSEGKPVKEKAQKRFFDLWGTKHG